MNRARAAASVFLFFLVSLAQARVIDVHAEIRVAKNGELTVIERITVDARRKGPLPVRELPGTARIAEVIRDGHPTSYVMDGTNLRLNAPLSEGRHHYQVTYRSARRIAHLGDHDALHWSAKDSERITAEVILPTGVPAREIKAEGKGVEYQSFLRDGRAAFRSRDYMTIVVRFPKGVVAEPGFAGRLGWFFEDFAGLLVVCIGLSLTAVLLLRVAKRPLNM
jgi:Predicted membrane protein (DUF2207)